MGGRSRELELGRGIREREVGGGEVRMEKLEGKRLAGGVVREKVGIRTREKGERSRNYIFLRRRIMFKT